MKTKQLKLFDLEPIRIDYILKSKIDRNISMNLANSIEDINDFKFALNLIETIKEPKAILEFSYIACDGNLLTSKYYKETLFILSKKQDYKELAKIRYTLCNVSVLNSNCYEIILNLINKEENITYILEVVENLIIYNDKPLMKEEFEKIINLNKITIERICLIMNNYFIDTNKVLEIIIKVLSNCDNKDINEKNIDELLNCIEKISTIKHENITSLLLNIISNQIDNQLTNEQNKILKFNLPKKLNYLNHE